MWLVWSPEINLVYIIKGDLKRPETTKGSISSILVYQNLQHVNHMNVQNTSRYCQRAHSNILKWRHSIRDGLLFCDTCIVGCRGVIQLGFQTGSCKFCFCFLFFFRSRLLLRTGSPAVGPAPCGYRYHCSNTWHDALLCSSRASSDQEPVVRGVLLTIHSSHVV